jgi:hypothetical protein
LLKRIAEELLDRESLETADLKALVQSEAAELAAQ